MGSALQLQANSPKIHDEFKKYRFRCLTDSRDADWILVLYKLVLFEDDHE